MSKTPAKSRQKIQGLKVNKRNESKVYRENARLRERIKKLETMVNTYRKKYNRLRAKYADPSSPSSKVKRIINNRPIPQDIENKLIEHVILEDQLETAAKSLTRHRDKKILGKIMRSAGNVVRKYKKIRYMSKFAPVRFMRRCSKTKLSASPNLEYEKTTRKTLVCTEAQKKDVQEFLERDSSSRMTSGKGETITKSKIKMQRRYLLKDMLDLHGEFQKTVDYSMSYSKFCKLRPFWVLFPKADQRDTCACHRHENMALILGKLHIEKVIPSRSSKALLKELTCSIEREDCMMRKCEECSTRTPRLLQHEHEKKIKYHQFQTVREEIIEERKKSNGDIEIVKKKATHWEKKESKCTLAELTAVLLSQLPEYMRHVFFNNHQTETLRGKRENLSISEGYLWFDFAENFSGKNPIETQGCHFGGSRQQFTLHTGVGYMTAEKQAYCTISDNRNHKPAQIMAHMVPVVNAVLDKLPEGDVNMHFQSDSPVNQYRGRDMFAHLAELLPLLFPSVKTFTWNYTEAGHGKGPVDGVGADEKRWADKKVAQGDDMNTWEQFKNCLMNKGNGSHKTKVFVVEGQDFTRIEEMTTHPKTFSGTRQVHQLTWTRDNPKMLLFNYLSCFDCPPGSKCYHFYLGCMDYSQPVAAEEVQAVDDIPAEQIETLNTSEQEPVNQLHQDPARASENNVIKKNSWVAVVLSGNLYPG